MGTIEKRGHTSITKSSVLQANARFSPKVTKVCVFHMTVSAAKSSHLLCVVHLLCAKHPSKHMEVNS